MQNRILFSTSRISILSGGPRVLGGPQGQGLQNRILFSTSRISILSGGPRVLGGPQSKDAYIAQENINDSF